MKHIDKISKISKEKIEQLASLINAKSPGAIDDRTLSDWKALPPAARAARIATFLEIRHYPDSFLKKVSKELYRWPWKLIGIGVTLVIICFLVMKIYEFYALPRAYMLDNNQTLTFGNKKIDYDFLGKKFHGRLVSGKSDEMLLVLSNEEGSIKVAEADFFKWFFGNLTATQIDSLFVTLDKAFYDESKRIFQKLIGDPFILEMDVNKRKMLVNTLKSHNLYSNAIIAQSSIPDSISEYLPFIVFEDEHDSSITYYFLALENKGTLSNIRIILKENQINSLDKIIGPLSKEFSNPLWWNKNYYIPPNSPIPIFKDPDSGKEFVYTTPKEPAAITN